MVANPTIIEKAKRFFGTTRNPLEAGYLLPDGSMLDFSGRHYAPGYSNGKPLPGKTDYLKNQKSVDHREVAEVIGSGGTNGMLKFMKATDVIRLSMLGKEIDLAWFKEQTLTPLQMSSLSNILSSVGGTIIYDLWDERGDTIKSGTATTTTELKRSVSVVPVKEEQVKAAHAKKLISEAFAKDLETKDSNYLQKLIVMLRDEESKALSVGVDTTKKAFTEQGFIIHNLSDAINHVIEIKKKKEQAAQAKESEEFGKPIPTEPEKPKVIGAPTRQERALREVREASHEGKKLRGQVTLFGAVSTSRRLGEFEEKPIIPQPQVKSMKDIQAEYLTKLCNPSKKLEEPLSQSQKTIIIDKVEIHDIEKAIQIIKECKSLDEFDKYEMEERLHHKAQGFEQIKKVKTIHKITTPKPKPETKISTMRDVMGKKGKEEPEIEDEVPEYKIVRPTLDVKRLNFGEAHNFLLAYNKHLPEMLRDGLQTWFIKHPQAQRFPLHQANYEQLFQVLSMYITPYPPKNLKELIAYKLIKDTMGVALEFGVALALSQTEWEGYYQEAKTKSKQIPELSTFKKDIIETLTTILPEIRVS